MAAPEVFTLTGGLELALYLYRPVQLQVEPVEHGIAGLELPDRLDRPPLEVPDVHSQHSPLK
jgi:hypothetical protein